MDDQVLQPPLEVFGWPLEAVVSAAEEWANRVGSGASVYFMVRPRGNLYSYARRAHHLKTDTRCDYHLTSVCVSGARGISAREFFSLVEQWEAEHNG